MYSLEEVTALESNFLSIISGGNSRTKKLSASLSGICNNKNHKLTSEEEELLFKAMESTLLMLKEIHESKGEIIEDYTFTKREPVTI